MYSVLKKIICSAVFTMMFLVPAMAKSEVSGQIRPEAAQKMLQDGNDRFSKNQRNYPNLGPVRLALTAKGQHPYAAVLACSDSRVPVEHIFDAGVGDIFVIKVAGNVAGVDETGSIEYAAEHLATPVVVVMGHTSCGAVTAAARGDKAEGSIPALIKHISPAVQKAKKIAGNSFSDGLVDASARMNVLQSIEEIFKNSHIVGELVKENKLMVIGALYHLDSGKVEWLGGHPEQKALVAAAGGADSHSFCSGKCAAGIISGLILIIAVFVSVRIKLTA